MGTTAATTPASDVPHDGHVLLETGDTWPQVEHNMDMGVEFHSMAPHGPACQRRTSILTRCPVLATMVFVLAMAPFEGTVWRLTHLGKTPIAAPADGREATLQFLGASSQVTGSTGCNRLSGRYTRNGNQLSLGPLATTRMACLGQNDLEPRFLAALERVAAYRVTENTLELSDASGEVLARFEGKR